MTWPRDTGRTATASLRSMTMDDAERLASIANYEELSKSISPRGSFPYPYTVSHALGLIEYAIASATAGVAFHFGILDESKSLIGVAAITKLDRENDGCEIGYWLGKDYHGRGYGSSAVSLLVSFAFRQVGVHRVYAASFISNVASVRLLKRLGFRQEGILRQSAKGDDGYADEVIMAMLKEEYEKSGIPDSGR